MTDYTSNGPGRRHVRVPKAEFYAYFAMIFAVALPFGLIEWARASVRDGRLSATGPVQFAMTQARIITPTIFSA